MDNPDYINHRQPVRPRYAPDGGRYLFRTRPKLQRRMIMMHTPANQIAALRLYRYANEDDFPLWVGIGDLYEWVNDNDDIFSKNNMGFVVVNSVIYEPRKLWVVKDAKAKSSYAFKYREDFIYGLEWMICTFFRKLMNKIIPAGETKIDTQEQMDEELRMLVNTPYDEYKEIYEEPILKNFIIPVFDWKALANEQGWEFQENLPPKLPEHKVAKPKKPVDLNSVSSHKVD